MYVVNASIEKAFLNLTIQESLPLSDRPENVLLFVAVVVCLFLF